MTRNDYDLAERLLAFAADVIHLVEKMPGTRAAIHVGGQLLRSGTSPLFNHGEAQGAESPDDFVHKMKVCLKELRETERALRLIARAPLVKNPEETDPLLQEVDQLIRIFVTSIHTARNNIDAKKKSRK